MYQWFDLIFDLVFKSNTESEQFSFFIILNQTKSTLSKNRTFNSVWLVLVNISLGCNWVVQFIILKFFAFFLFYVLALLD